MCAYKIGDKLMDYTIYINNVCLNLQFVPCDIEYTYFYRCGHKSIEA